MLLFSGVFCGSAAAQFQPRPETPGEVNVRGKYQLQTYQENSSLDCGPLFESYLNQTGPASTDERRSGRIPAGDYSVATTIETPLLAGGQLIGASGETDLYGTNETAAFDSTVTRLTWRGAADGGPMFLIQGTAPKISDMSLNGLSATTQANLLTNMADRASVGILIEDRETSPEPPFGPGKLAFDVLQLQAFDVAIQLGEGFTGNQADELNGRRLYVAYSGTAMKTLNNQSVNNTIGMVHCFGVNTVIDFTGGGRFELGTVYCGAAGVIDDTVFLSVPADSQISANHCEVTVNALSFDGSMDEGRLIVMAEAEKVRLKVNQWKCTTQYTPVAPNVLYGDAHVMIGHWHNAIANSFECHESGNKCPVIFVDNVDPKTGEDSADLIDPDSTGVCYVVYGGGTVTNAAAPVVRVQTWDDGVLIETKELGTGGGSVATDAIFNAAGDLVYGTGSDTATRLAVGTAGQVLNVNAGATAPAWTSALNGVTLGTTNPVAGYFDTALRYYLVGDPAASNQEFLGVTTDAANFYFLTDQAGTGQHRALSIGTQGNVPLRMRTNGVARWDVDGSGHLIPITDSTYNIGASGTEVLNVFADNVTVATEVYDATGWNSDLTVPTKDAVRDKIESIVAGSGDVATDTIWDAAGDLAVGSGADTAARLAKGTALQVLRVNAGATALEWADVSVSDAELNALAGLTSAADKLPYFTGSGTAALADLGSAARAILDGATSAEVATLVSNETGTGVLAFATAPTFTTTATVTDANGSAVIRGTTISVNDDTSNLTWDLDFDGGLKILNDSALAAEFEANGALAIEGALTVDGTTFSSFGLSLADDANAAAAHITLTLDSPVVRREPDGDVFFYGQNAANNADRGAALLSAITAAGDGDTISLGPGGFTISDQSGTVIKTITDTDLTIEGSGEGITTVTASADTLLSVNGSAIVRIANLTVGSAALVTLSFNGTATIENVSSVVGNPIDSSSGSGVIDWYGGVVDSPSGFAFDPTGCTTRYHNLTVTSVAECFDTTGAANTVELHNCTLASSTTGVAAILNGGTMRIYGGSITSHAGGLDIDNSGTISVSASTSYNSSKTSGTITKLPAYGVTPGATGLALLDDASASAGRDTLGATSGVFPVAAGGTGASTLTGLLQGNGTSAFTAVTNSTTVGQILRVTGSNTYGFGALDLADTDAVTGVLPDANAATTLARDSEVFSSTTATSAATLTPVGSSVNNYAHHSAQAEALAIAAPSGTPVGGYELTVRIKDNATTRGLTWNPIYRNAGAALPATTTVSKWHTVGFKYNAVDSKWDCIGVTVEP